MDRAKPKRNFCQWGHCWTDTCPQSGSHLNQLSVMEAKMKPNARFKKQSLPRVIWIKAHARGWLKIWGSAQDLLYAKVILGWFLFNFSLVTCSELHVALACFLKSFQTTDILPLINVSGRIIFSFVSCHRKSLKVCSLSKVWTQGCLLNQKWSCY